MKKIFVGLTALLVLAAFVSAGTLAVVGPKTGTQEYFGIAKVVQPTGIKWVLGATYKDGDYLTFTLPGGLLFGTPSGGVQSYYLVSHTGNNTNPLRADVDTDGTPEWSYFLGGGGQATLTFRVTDIGLASIWTSATTWYLCTVSGSGGTLTSAAAITGAVPVLVPIGCPPGTYNLTVEAIDGISGIGGTKFDGTPITALLFTVYQEFTATLTAITETIDVAFGRKAFVPTGKIIAGSATGITVTKAAGYDYITTLAANDLFRNTVIGDMTGVSYAQFYATTMHPASMTQAVVNVPGTTITAQSGVASPAYIVVNGTTTLIDRSFTDTLAFVPTGTWFARILLNAVPFQTWSTNGTVFRSVFFASAIAAGNYSAFRIANHSAEAADIWVEVWLDDGQKTTSAVKLPTSIPANGKWSINGWDLAVQAGLLPDANMTDGSWRGRVIFTIWAPSPTTFGTEVYQVGGLGYTEITLEKIK
jgi:hypothetical protein